MKALAASLITAAVLTGVAWSQNLTPPQLAKLATRVRALQSQVSALQHTSTCLTTQVDKLGYRSFTLTSWDGFPTASGTLTVFTAPSQVDNLPAVANLIVTSVPPSPC